jgi:type 2 lantibiotic biosynthesis protein LanM
VSAPIQIPETEGSLAASIAAGASGLYDRFVAAPPAEGAPAADVLEPWVRAFSPDAPEALVRRLAWDGLDPAAAGRAIASPASPTPPPSWTAWLAKIAEEARRLTRDEAAELAAGERTLPFVELWLPVVRAARAELQRRAGAALEAFAPSARAVLERQLLREVATIASQAAFERFRARLPQDTGAPTGDASATRVYAAFTRDALDDGLTALFAEFPVVARLLSVLAETWTEATAELAGRLRADEAALSATFAGGQPIGPVESVEAGMGDRHHGGRRVLVLVFGGGRKVVYKPRDLGLEAAYHRFLGWASGEGLDVTPPLRVLEREGYGWVEFAAQGGFQDLEDVRQYYRRAGALMCLAHVLRGRDLHMENVVASVAGPQLVDTEMLVQPEPAGVGVLPGSRDARGAGEGRPSCLETGLLSMFQRDNEGAMFDIGGLRGAGGGRAPVARRVWKGLGTDALQFVLDGRFEPTERNGVRLGGEDQPAEHFAEEMVSGFVAAYLFLLDRRDLLLSPEGPTRDFAGRPVRVLFRTTTQYGALQYVLTAPQYQRSGLRRSFALDSLNRCFAQDRSRPLLWPLVAEERRALEQLDIPHFTVPSDATTVVAGGAEAIAGYFRRSGLDAVLDRVRGLSEEDLAAQVDALRGALASSAGSRFQAAAPAPDRPIPVEERLVEHAEWIGRELLAHAEEGPDLSWPALGTRSGRFGWGPHHLYDGTAGPVLFLSALAAVTGEAAWADAARDAARPLARALASGLRVEGTGADGSTGVVACLGSVAYALGLSGDLLGDEAFLELALGVAALVTPERIEADPAWDVVSGAAGAALALTALHELRSEGWLLDRASRCARRLVAAAVEPSPGVRAWPAGDGRLLAGFGHGAAGIALALVRVAAATGEGGLLDTARAAHRYERTLFAAPQRNWRIVGPNNFMAAWCHGAPGIGLERVLVLEALDDADLRADVDAALQTTADAAPHGSDHLCCGRLGRAEVLLTAGRRLGRKEWVEAAQATAAGVAERAARERRFAVPSTEFEYPVFHPGFFKGLSGIGYELLRVALPARVPSVLGLEAR